MAPTKRGAKADAPLATKSNEEINTVHTSSVAKVEKAVKAGSEAASQLPQVVQFPLTAALSFALSTLGSVIMSQMSQGELQSLVRSPETWDEVALVTFWRTAELALAWFSTQNTLEAVSMNVLAHGPLIFLLTTFYGLSTTSAISALIVDILSIAIPFYLVLPLSTADEPNTRNANRDILDIPMQALTSILSTGIYTVTLVLSLRFLLPRILVIYFNGLPTLEPAYSASYGAVLPMTLLFGVAASTFIFTPFATTGKAKEDAKLELFDPVHASLGQTVWWNFWGYTAKTKVVILRTAAAAFLSGVSTYLACTQRMYGVESTGAVAYASVWVVSAILAGVGLGFVGGD